MSLFTRRTEGRVTNSVQGLEQLNTLRQQLAGIAEQTVRAAEQEVAQSEAAIRTFTDMIRQEQADISEAQRRSAEAEAILSQVSVVRTTDESFGGTDYENEHIVPPATDSI